MKKRGISPVIGVLLLVVLAVVAIGIIFFFARSQISKETERSLAGMTREEVCSEVRFSIEDLCFEESEVVVVGTGASSSEKRIKFLAGNDNPNVDIYAFSVSLSYEDRSIIIPSLIFSGVKGFKSSEIRTEFIEDINNLQSIKISPEMKAGEDIFVCENVEKIFTKGEITICLK